MGTAAGTVGDFGTSTEVEIASLTTADAQDIFMPILGTAESAEKLHAIKWGKGIAGGPYEHGIIAGALANGSVSIWNPSVMMGHRQGESNALLSSTEKHSGPVQALDFNPNQPNLLASGGPNSEIFIWDVTNPATPKTYTPGAKVSAQSDITCVEWNKKVQHILASTAFNGVTVVWDLRAKRPLLTFSDPNKKQRCRAMVWNPAEATMLATASEDDASPVIQLWDLRNTFSPTKYLEGHTKGIWSLSWSAMDTSLLLSCGKGNEVFCWNTETAKIRCQVETTNSWNSQVEWSPCVPAVLATCSMEGQVKVFSLQDPTPKSIPSRGSLKNVDFSAPPKWLKRPAGAAFGFGGKLVSFTSQSEGPKTVRVRTIVTDQTFVDRSQRLEEALKSNDCKAYCEEKMTNSANEQEKAEWSLLSVLFESSARTQLLAHLGFGPEETNQKVLEFISRLPDNEKEAEHAKEEETEEEEKEAPAEEKASEDEPSEEEAKKEEDDASALFGGSPAASTKEGEDVSNLFGAPASSGAPTDSSFDMFGAPPPSEGHDPFAALGQPSGSDDPFAQIAANLPPAETGSETSAASTAKAPLMPIPTTKATIKFDLTEDNSENIITRSLIVGNFEAAVNCCMKIGRTADALVLAACGGPDLWAKTQEAYFARHTMPFMKLISSIVKNEMQTLVASTELHSWKGTLAILCTYAKSEEFPVLCDFLASRLEAAGDTRSAVLCYICAGNIDKAVNAWVNASINKDNDSVESLLEVLEKVSIFRRAIDYNDMSDVLANKYSQYAEALASQGRLQTAMGYLSQLNDPKFQTPSSTVLLHRVANALNQQPAAGVPPFPFQSENVRPEQGGAQHQTPAGASAQPTGPQRTAGLTPGGYNPSAPVRTAGPSTPSFTPSVPSAHPVAHPVHGHTATSGPSPFPTGPSHRPAAGGSPSPFPEPPRPSNPAAFPQPVAAPGGQGSGAYIPAAARAAGYTEYNPATTTFEPHPVAPSVAMPSAGGAGAPSVFPTVGPTPVASAVGSAAPTVFTPSASGSGAVPTVFTPVAPAAVGSGSTPTVFTPVAPAGVSGVGSGSTTVFTPSVSQPTNTPPTSQTSAPAPAPAAPPKLTKEPTALSGEIVNKFSTIVDSLSQRVGADPRKARAMTDAKGRMNELYEKLKTGQYSDELEALLHEFAVALETENKANVTRVHKVLAGSHWEDLGSKVMIGIKRIMDIAMP